MTARAMWKGVVKIGTHSVPVKLYSAVQQRSVHFRLLHKTDHEPVQQQLISADSGDPIEFEEVRKGFPLTKGRMVLLEKEELEELEPEDSRDIEVTRFVDPSELDHRLYERAYYLGPDGNTKTYFAVVAALEKKKKEGIARWVMRDKEYVGSLRAENGYLMLITLRHADEIISAAALKPPEGRELLKRELQMAEQLIDALHGEFVDEYTERLEKLVAQKEKKKADVIRVPEETDDENGGGAEVVDLMAVLSRSLGTKKRAV